MTPSLYSLRALLLICGLGILNTDATLAQTQPIRTLAITMALGFDSANTQSETLVAIKQTITQHRRIYFTRELTRQPAQTPGIEHYVSTPTTGASQPLLISLTLLYPTPNTPPELTVQRFRDHLRSDDMILYFGHSRNGDGFPEFAASSATTGKHFINDPIRGWLGFDQVNFNRSKYQILGLIGCHTRQYFYEPLRQLVWEKPPNSLGLLLTNDYAYFDDFSGYVEAILNALLESNTDQLSRYLDARSSTLQATSDRPVRQQFHFEHFDLRRLGTHLNRNEQANTPQRVYAREPYRDIPF